MTCAGFLLLAAEGALDLDACTGSLLGDGRFALSVRRLLHHLAQPSLLRSQVEGRPRERVPDCAAGSEDADTDEV